MSVHRLIPALALIAALGRAEAQTAPAAGPPANPPPPRAPSATLEVWNRRVVEFRATYGSLTPAERAQAAARRIQELPDRSLGAPVQVERVAIGADEGRMVLVDSHPLFGILPGDVDVLSGETLDSAAAAAAASVHSILAARAEFRSAASLRRALIETALATLILSAVLWSAQRLRRLLEPQVTQIESRITRVRLMGMEAAPHVRALLQKTVGVVIVGICLAAIYVWITFVFSLFPYTRPWGQAFGRSLVHALVVIGQGLLHALPGLGMVVLIFLLTRFAVQMVGSLFRAAETGVVNIPGVHPETAEASRRIATWLLWLFAVIMAYPYLPGSGTDVFKGISVFAGLLLSLGASGVVNQVMSGLVVVYSRSVRVGEFVQVGDTQGTVTEIGMLSTKILTRRKEEITIPNAVLVGAVTTNFSRREGEDGAVVATSVTIGYDAPWRQVHAMLLMAAERTSGVLRDPAPRVLQYSLSDFYVQYDLLVNIEHADQRFVVMSELHSNIQDAFNEFGVQIMSPHFEGQPEGRITVPRAKWHETPAAPAAPPSATRKSSAPRE